MKNYRDGILFLLMSLFWAINYPLLKIAVHFENEFYVVFFRIFFALLLSIIIFPTSLRIGKSFKLHLKLFVISMLNIVGFMEFWFIGEMTETASVSSIIIYSYPVIIVLLSIFFLNEKVKIVNLSGIFLGLAGIVLIFSNEMEINSLSGLIFLILSAISWSFGTLIYKKYLNGIEPVKVNTMQFIYSLPVTFIIAILSGPFSVPGFNVPFLMITIYMGALGTAIAYFIYLYLYRKYPVSKISSFLFLIPTLSVILSILMLGESISIINLIGFAFVMIGIYLSQRG